MASDSHLLRMEGGWEESRSRSKDVNVSLLRVVVVLIVLRRGTCMSRCSERREKSERKQNYESLEEERAAVE